MMLAAHAATPAALRLPILLLLSVAMLECVCVSSPFSRGRTGDRAAAPLLRPTTIFPTNLADEVSLI